MQTIAAQLHAAFAAAIQSAFDLNAEPMIGLSQNTQFGDYQSNAAMSLAKLVTEKTGQKTNPRQVAEQIVAKLDLGDIADGKPSIAGPGFINVKLNPAWLSAQINAIAKDAQFALPKAESPQTVVVDYSGVNIAKEMLVWHLRSTIIGDAIANVLEQLGHQVTRRNHLGDWGTQFGRVVLAMWYKWAFEENNVVHVLSTLITETREAVRTKDEGKLSEVVRKLVPLHRDFYSKDPDTLGFGKWLDETDIDLQTIESLYQFTSIVTDSKEAEHHDIGNTTLSALPRLITKFIQNPKITKNAQEQKAWQKSRDVTMRTIQAAYVRLGVRLRHEHERGESAYNDELPKVVTELKEKGIAVDSEGAVVVFVDGPEKSPLIIQKSDGSFLYGTTDLAAIRERIFVNRADRIVYTHDSRQAQHFSQVFRTAGLASWTRNGAVKLEYAPFGTMLGTDGKPFKTRSGETLKLSDLLDEATERAAAVVKEKNPALSADDQQKIAHAVGIGAVKYADLSKDRISDYVFSWDKMLSFEGNTAPYLQYVYARIQSIFRKAGGSPTNMTVTLESPFELALAKHILRLGEVVELVAKELKPHLLCTYLYELASKFSGFYENCPVLVSEEPMRSSRLALCDATAKTMATGLDLLGIEHPDQM